jgi:enterochelin esterase-like enzyme
MVPLMSILVLFQTLIFVFSSHATGKCDLRDPLHKICTPVDFTKKRTAGETEQGCFFSSAIRQETCYTVTFPKNFPTTEPSPYTVFLHGRGSNDRQFTDFCNACASSQFNQPCFDKEGPPSLIISPSETAHTYWKNSPDGKIKGADMISADLVKHLETQSAHMSKDPARRGIMGISMGGHGATYISMTKPGVFDAGLYAISPVFRDEAHLAPEDVTGYGHGAAFRERDPSALLQGNRNILNQVRFKMEIAPDDGFYAPQEASTRSFFNIAKGAYPKEVAVQGNGGHSLTYWCGALQRSMSFFKDRYQTPAATSDVGGANQK